MPIKFSCDCGQALSAREEIAGKRVRCSACSKAVTVPGDGGGAAVAAAEPVRFECDDCGRAMQAKAVSVGKRVKCPGCESVMVVPAGAEPGRKRPSAAIQEDSPPPRRRAQEKDQEGEEEEEVEKRPKKKKKKKLSAKGGVPWLWVGVGSAAALLIGLGVFFLFIKGKGGSDGKGGDKDGSGDSASRTAALNNFAQVALAMINYCDQNNGRMFLNAIYDRQTGQPLLSWRVAILPQLGEEALFRQIRLTEPWDSPHNKQFWSKMPRCYEMTGLPASEGKTAVQVFTKDGPIYKPAKPLVGLPYRFPASISDGLSTTICCAEAKEAVNWMEPRDLDTVNMADIMASLGNRTGSGPIASFWDGSKRALPKGISNSSLKVLVTCDEGDVVGSDAGSGGR